MHYDQFKYTIQYTNTYWTATIVLQKKWLKFCNIIHHSIAIYSPIQFNPHHSNCSPVIIWLTTYNEWNSSRHVRWFMSKYFNECFIANLPKKKKKTRETERLLIQLGDFKVRYHRMDCYFSQKCILFSITIEWSLWKRNLFYDFWLLR